MKSILITDSLFIFPEHVKQLEDAGYKVERLDKPKASDEELKAALKGKAGYILGGIEHVTDEIIEAADQLEALAFTGSGFRELIPGWQRATHKGIAISNIPDGPTHAVAEWAITAALVMQRGFFELGPTGEKTFMTTPGLFGQTFGIIGLGNIGSRMAELLKPFHPAKVLYYSAHRHEDKEQSLGVEYAEMQKVLSESNVVFLCVPVTVGDSFFSSKEFDQMKQGALLVSFMHSGILNEDALYNALDAGKIRAISDYPMSERFSKFSPSSWYSFKGSNAFNTHQSLQYMSDEATKSLLNLLKTGDDKNLVNPEYREYRKK